MTSRGAASTVVAQKECDTQEGQQLEMYPAILLLQMCANCRLLLRDTKFSHDVVIKALT